MPGKRPKRPFAGSNTARGKSGKMAQGTLDSWVSQNLSLEGPSNAFSMRDEARNTASHQSIAAWSPGGIKLRQKPVAFVSAGWIEPLKDSKLLDPSDEANVEEPADGDNAPVMGEATVRTIELTDVVATVGQENENPSGTGDSIPQEQSIDDPSQALDLRDVDAEDLFFYDLVGNKAMDSPPASPPKIPNPKSSVGGSDSSEEVILFKGRSGKARGTVKKREGSQHSTRMHPSVTSKSKAPATAPIVPAAKTVAPPNSVSRQHEKKRGLPIPVESAEDGEEDEDAEDAILADYIANMLANSEDDFVTHQLQSYSGHRDLGGDDDAFNFGSADEERLPYHSGSLNNEGTDSEDLDTSDVEEDEPEGEEEQDMAADMDDEELARLFAKQEELGIGGDELILASAGSYAKAEGKRARRNLPAAAGSKKFLNGFANATSVADAFDDLNIGQPARRRKTKQPPNFNVSDSEIDAALKMAWRRDRERKKKRKMDREALRAQGLLGKNVNPDDMRIRYPSAMTLDNFKTEIASFLIGTEERLEFPPLDKHARKILHLLASKFNIKSQSTGSGVQRRPVLYRTNRTVRYSETRVGDVTSHVEAAAVQIRRKYFHRVDLSTPVKRASGSASGRPEASRTGIKALRLREGEIVGASVPELGQDNKGRAMLEKMGWSKGMALGAMDNKGILEPVAQVVKHSKAGLG